MNRTLRAVGGSSETVAYDDNLTADSLAMTLSFAQADGTATADYQASLTGIETGTRSALPASMRGQADFGSALDAGFEAETRFSFVSSVYSSSSLAEGVEIEQQGMSGEGTFSGALSRSGITFDVEQDDIDSTTTMAAFPGPIETTVAHLALGVTLPWADADEPQDFGLRVELRELTLPDTIWALFDPAGQLPRVPSTILLALSGQARLLVDPFDADMEAALENDAAPPVELETLTLDAFEISTAGARLTGAGGVTFDNTDLETFSGVPRPEGAVDLRLAGGNGLLTALVEMGLLPLEQANGMRMMMGLFAVPGEGEDVLNSRIEINDQGHVLANGQRIR